MRPRCAPRDCRTLPRAQRSLRSLTRFARESLAGESGSRGERVEVASGEEMRALASLARLVARFAHDSLAGESGGSGERVVASSHIRLELKRKYFDMAVICVFR